MPRTWPDEPCASSCGETAAGFTAEDLAQRAHAEVLADAVRAPSEAARLRSTVDVDDLLDGTASWKPDD